jgi:cytoskeleton protein RodZ
VVLGNASAVEVQQAGSTVDIAPYRRANVARFTVSSDGSLAPVAD